MKTRRIRKGGMMNSNQMVIPQYSPISSKGGRRHKIKTRKYRTRRSHKR